MPKSLAKQNLYAYKSTMGENLSTQYSKIFAKKRASLQATLYCIYMRKMELLSNIGKLWPQ